MAFFIFFLFTFSMKYDIKSRIPITINGSVGKIYLCSKYGAVFEIIK